MEAEEDMNEADWGRKCGGWHEQARWCFVSQGGLLALVRLQPL